MEARRCPSCRAELPEVPGLRFCPHCGALLPAAVLGIPMEQRRTYGLFNALWHTWRQACLEPMAFFRQVGFSQDVGAAVVFMLIVNLVTGLASGLLLLAKLVIGLASGLWLLVNLQAPLWALARKEGLPISPLFGGAAGALLLAPLVFLLSALIGWAISTAVLHLLLLIVGGARKGMSTTALVLAYASAPQVFNVVPWLGGLVASIWSLVLLIVGLSQAHETDTWRAVLAVFLPLLLCCGIILLAVLLPALAALQRAAG